MAGDQQKFQAAMAQAEQLSQQDNWEEASRAYRFALAEFPNNEMAIIGFGKASLATGQIEFAQRAFQQVLRINPTSYEALSHMGDIQERTGQLDAAAETYLRVGNVFVAQNDFDSAIDYWTRATKLAPGQIEAHRKLADALHQQGQTRQAARELLTLAAIHQRRNDLDQAMEQIQKAEQLLPDNPGIAAAINALQSGDPIRPNKIDEEAPSPPPPSLALDFEPEFSEDQFLDEDPFAIDEFDLEESPRGGLLESTQQEALAELANLIFEDDTNPNTLLIIQAIDLQRSQKLAEAVDNYRQAIQSGVKKPAIYFNLGLLCKDLGQFDVAAEMLNMSLGDKKYNLCSHYALGETYYAANNLEMAIKHFIEIVKVIDMQTVSGEKVRVLLQYYENLANTYLAESDRGKIDNFVQALRKFFSDSAWERKAREARQRLDSISENGVMSLAEYLETPETEIIINAMALTSEYLSQNLLMTASEECLRAIQKAPSYLPLHVRLADILLKQEQTDQAIAKYLMIANVYQMRNTPEQAVGVYEKILQMVPMDVTVRSKLIDLYTSRNEVEQALDQYLILADSYYQLAQVDRALEKYNEALRLTTNVSNADIWKADILSRMGDIYNQRFDWTRSTAAYEELIKIRPDDEHINRHLIDLYYKQNKTDQAIGVLDNLLTVYQRQDPSKAVQLLRELVSSFSNDMVLRKRLASVYIQNNMTREAIAEYDALGEMQLENGLREEAKQTIQAILDLGPDDTEGYRRLLSQI